jgi:PAS domain S-box-containing protein
MDGDNNNFRTDALLNIGDYFQIFQSIPAPAAITAMRDGRFIEVNDGFCREIGYSRSELLNHTSLELGMYLQPEDRVQLMEAIKRSSVYNIERTFRLKSGEPVLFLISSSILDRPGEPYILTVLQNLREKEELKMRVRETAIKFQTLFENSRDAIGVSKAGIHAYVNPSYLKLYGYSSFDELAGRPLFDLIAPNSRNQMREIVRRRAQGTDAPTLYETRGIRKDCTEFDMEVQSSTYELEGERYTVGLIRDITERMLEQRLIAARLRISNLPLENLDLNSFMRTVLDEAEALTGSQIGFFHFVDDDQNTISLQTWSTNTLKTLCTAEGNGQHYPVADAGVWADGIRDGVPHIYNDYPHLPTRRELPPGHAPVTRLISIPIKRDNRVVAAIGVGNKPTNYTERDLEMVQRLAEESLDIIMRKRAEDALGASEERFRAAFQTGADAFILVNEADRLIIEVNDQFLQLYGYTREEVIGQTTLELGMWVVPERRAEALNELDLNDRMNNFEVLTRKKSGEIFPVLLSASKVKIAQGSLFLEVIHDITERKRAENQLRQVNRELKAISKCNSVLMHTENEQTLLQEICQIVCDEAGYRMAWVGFAKQDEDKNVYPTAWAGKVDDYLTNANITWSDTARGQGPTGTSIRTGQSVYIQDFENDPSVAPWRGPALQQGYRSCIALPLIDENAQVFGALAIYSKETNAFSATERRLLEELASDLSFGINVIHVRAGRQQAEELVRNQNRMLLTLHNAALEIGVELHLPQLLENILQESQSLMNANRGGGVYLYDPDEGVLRLAHGTGINRGRDGIIVRIGEGVAGRVFRSAQTLIIEDYSHWEGHATVLVNEPPSSVMGIPLFIQGTVTGVLTFIANSAQRKFTDQDAQQAQMLAAQFAIAIQNAQLYRQAENEIAERKRVNEVLHENEARLAQYQLLFEHTRDICMFVRFSDGRILEANRAAEMAYGYPREELLKQTITNLRAPETRTQVQSQMATANAEGLLFETIHQRKDGMKFAVEVSSMGMNYSGEQVILSIVRDITERKKVNEALLESERKYRELVENANSIIMRWGRDGRLIFMNEFGLRFFGYDQSELTGRSLIGTIVPETESTGRDLEHLMDEICADPRAFEQNVNENIKHNGERVWISWTNKIVLDKHGEVKELLTIGSDITERVQAEQDVRNAHQELAQAYDATIEGWSQAMDLRDKETEGHTQRVTELSVRLGQIFGLSPEEVLQVHRGALLHDIGKMGVPDAILLKPGKLTDEEWLIMRKHPELAYRMLSSIDYLKGAISIPYCHHEKWDGTGYPRGLKGDEIPIEARIFSVVDVWDALTSDRPYRSAWSPEKTLEYIADRAGFDFDPQVVKKFMDLVMRP